MAVASREGLSGGVGDSGHAFGPFQLNDAGGVITGRPGNHRAFAESPEGIAWALGQIAQVAKGQRGQQAINSIVRRFERPANPDAEVAGALASYGQFGSNGATPVPTSRNVSAGLTAPPSPISIHPGNYTVQTQSPGAGMVQHPQIGYGQFVAATLAPKQQPGRVKATHTPGPNVPASPAAAGIVGIAAKQLGQPYVWGGESRKEGGFDCSGLVDWSMRQMGYQGPRLTTYNIAKIGQSVKGHPLQPGDLVLCNKGEHVVIYAGHGKVIAAPHTGTVVQYQPLSKFAITDVRRV